MCSTNMLQCTLCLRNFHGENALTTHLWDSHDGYKNRLTPLACPEADCTVAIQGRFTYNRHRAEHRTGLSGLPLCPGCDDVFSTLHDLIKHVKACDMATSVLLEVERRQAVHSDPEEPAAELEASEEEEEEENTNEEWTHPFDVLEQCLDRLHDPLAKEIFFASFKPVAVVSRSGRVNFTLTQIDDDL